MLYLCGCCCNLFMNKKIFYFFSDINNKLYITDFGASRKLELAQTTLVSQMAGSFSWSSYEDVGGTQSKYKKESDIQVS